MDSRDITLEPPALQPGETYLSKIFEAQKGLIDHYVHIEGLPQYPLDVNVKTSQTILKDFTSRVIEELAEGYEAWVMANKLCYELEISTESLPTKAEKAQAILNHYQNVGEEMADALHFFTELFIYAGITPADVREYCLGLMEKLEGDNINVKHPDSVASIGANLTNLIKYRGTWAPNFLFQLIKHNNPEDEVLKDLRYVTCGLAVGSQYEQAFARDLWEITYYLNIARNQLKNKPWKQSQVMTAEGAYREYLLRAFVTFWGMLYAMGCNEEQIWFLYFKKNQINHFRIKSKY